MRATTCLILLLLFICEFSFSQVAQPDRFEIEVSPFENYFDVINGEKDGLLLIRQNNERNRQGDPQFEFILLDTSLHMVWQNKINIDRYLEYRGYDYFGGYYYLLFKYLRGNSRDLRIIKMETENGDTTHYKVANFVPIQLSEFEITHNSALIGGYYNYNPLLIHFDFTTDKTKVLPGVYQNKTELLQLKVDDVSGNFVVITSEKTIDKRNTLSVKTYDFSGELKGNTILEPDDNLGLITGHAADFDFDVNLMGGTYAGKRSTFSRGLFIANIEENGDQEINYYNYGDLENFFNYMRAKKRKRISNKIERKKIKGKKIKFNYRLLVHEIIEKDDQFIMLGEAYYPKYSSNSYGNAYYYNSYMYPSNYGMYFVGYRYTHAVVIGFDKNGNILWDNSFEIDDVLSYDLEQFVHADAREDSIVLLYLYDNEIRSKIIQGNEVLEGKSFDQIKLSFEYDVIRENESEVESLEPWYDNKFYAYGEQKIKNMRDTGVKLNRRVFYINKVLYK